MQQHNPPVVINGWSMYAHPLFIDQLTRLLEQFHTQKLKFPDHYQKKNAAKRLAAVVKLAFYTIPNDPTHAQFRQGATLGKTHQRWFRAKFFQQYRLFFRFDLSAKVIVLAWVNDENSKRAYDSKTDAYKVFAQMLNNGHPSDDWTTLLHEAKGALNRFSTLTTRAPFALLNPHVKAKSH